MIRFKILFFFLFCKIILLKAQNFGDTLIIFCSKDSYWNSNPKYAHKESLIITYIGNNNFQRNRYKFIKQSKIDTTTQKRIISFDTLFKTDIIKLDTDFISGIKKEMETTNNNFTSQEFINMVGKIKRKHIRTAIKKPTKKGKLYLNFDGNDLKEIQNFAYLNEYIIYLKNIGKYYTTDVWNSLFITIENASNYVTIHQDFLYNSGQPMSVYNKNTDTRVFGLINPLLNTKLAKVVPRKSYLKNYVTINNYRDDYILWYLENQFDLHYPKKK